MEKKLTPVGTILEWIDEAMESVAAYRDLETVRKVAAAQLPEEQKMVDRAVWHGHDERGAAGMVHVAETMGTDYFTNTYRQK